MSNYENYRYLYHCSECGHPFAVTFSDRSPGCKLVVCAEQDCRTAQLVRAPLEYATDAEPISFGGVGLRSVQELEELDIGAGLDPEEVRQIIEEPYG